MRSRPASVVAGAAAAWTLLGACDGTSRPKDVTLPEDSTSVPAPAPPVINMLPPDDPGADPYAGPCTLITAKTSGDGVEIYVSVATKEHSGAPYTGTTDKLFVTAVVSPGTTAEFVNEMLLVDINGTLDSVLPEVVHANGRRVTAYFPLPSSHDGHSIVRVGGKLTSGIEFIDSFDVMTGSTDTARGFNVRRAQPIPAIDGPAFEKGARLCAEAGSTTTPFTTVTTI